MSYVYVLVSNESNEPVYFDNFTVSHERGQLIGEDHYYAYGLKIASISSKSVNSSLNFKMVGHGYQGSYSEEVTEFELNYSEFFLRTYDPQIGRWTTTDPYDQFASPYTGMGMDPSNNTDPSGGVVPDFTYLSSASSSFTASFISSMSCGVSTTSSSVSMALTVASQSVSMLAMGGNVAFNAMGQPVPNWMYFRESIIYGNTFFDRETWLKTAEANGINRYAYVVQGTVFENSVIRSRGANKNTQFIFPYPDEPNTYFIPDMLGDFDFVKWRGFFKLPTTYHFGNAVIEEVKFTTKEEVPLDRNRNWDQIIGFIDYLGSVRGVTINGVYNDQKISDYGVASIVITTPANVSISPFIIRYASNKNVNLYQRVAIQVQPGDGWTNETSSNFRISEVITLNRAKAFIKSPAYDVPIIGSGRGRKIEIKWKP